MDTKRFNDWPTKRKKKRIFQVTLGFSVYLLYITISVVVRILRQSLSNNHVHHSRVNKTVKSNLQKANTISQKVKQKKNTIRSSVCVILHRSGVYILSAASQVPTFHRRRCAGLKRVATKFAVLKPTVMYVVIPV